MTAGTIDDTLLRLEHGVRVTMYHWVLAHHFCYLFLAAVYCALPVAEALVLIVSARRLACLASIVLAGLFAPIFYMIFPAVGPAWVGVADAPRNCVPSLHLTWALLLILYIPARLRPLAIIFAVLTACATLGLGQHYIIDLIAAVPYTWAVFLLPFEVRFARRRSSNATYPAEALPGNSLNS
jgi:membrane-associated phospholipid phosphatase